MNIAHPDDENEEISSGAEIEPRADESEQPDEIPNNRQHSATNANIINK
jgi:hypothetical protein